MSGTNPAQRALATIELTQYEIAPLCVPDRAFLGLDTPLGAGKFALQSYQRNRDAAQIYSVRLRHADRPSSNRAGPFAPAQPEPGR